MRSGWMCAVFGMAAFLLALGPSSSSWGQSRATYYVAVNGSDSSGDGTQGDPWATIEHAVDTVPDGSLVLVGPGEYLGRVRIDRAFAVGIVVRSEQRYRARLRNSGTVVTCYYGKGITLEGFDIAHSGPGAGALVIQIQDLIGEPGGADKVSNIVLRDNVLHDSYNNDILKINNGCGLITVEGNVFYNQSGSDEHIDINSVTDVVVQDNVFFNDFEGSGRDNNNDTSSFIVIKDSNGSSDSILGSDRITVRRNVFLNWQGSSGSNFVLAGEDGNNYYEARNVLVENNLMLGNSGNTMRAAFGVKGCRDITFRNNTVTGNLPSLAYAMRLNVEGANLPNDNVSFFNNIWSDASATMDDFSDTPPGETLSWALDHNLFFNGGAAIPVGGSDLVNVTDDANAVIADPGLPAINSIVLPRWLPGSGIFADGSTRISEIKRRLVEEYGVPAGDGPVVDAADPAESPAEDILGQPRYGGLGPDSGAFETGVGLLFSDGFESGDLFVWSNAVP